MAHEILTRKPDDRRDAFFAEELAEFESDVRSSTLSLPIIFLTSASGVGAGIIGLYIAYIVIGLGIEASAGLAALSLCIAVGISGATLSMLADSTAAATNIVFSCALMMVAVLFLALCYLVGAVAATIALAFGL